MGRYSQNFFPKELRLQYVLLGQSNTVAQISDLEPDLAQILSSFVCEILSMAKSKPKSVIIEIDWRVPARPEPDLD